MLMEPAELFTIYGGPHFALLLARTLLLFAGLARDQWLALHEDLQGLIVVALAVARVQLQRPAAHLERVCVFSVVRQRLDVYEKKQP